MLEKVGAKLLHINSWPGTIVILWFSSQEHNLFHNVRLAFNLRNLTVLRIIQGSMELFNA